MYSNDDVKLLAAKPTLRAAESELSRKLAIMLRHQNDLEEKIQSIQLAVEIDNNRDRQYRATRLLVDARNLLNQSGVHAQHADDALKRGDVKSAWSHYKAADKALVTGNVMKDRSRATLQREVLF